MMYFFSGLHLNPSPIRQKPGQHPENCGKPCTTETCDIDQNYEGSVEIKNAREIDHAVRMVALGLSEGPLAAELPFLEDTPLLASHIKTLEAQPTFWGQAHQFILKKEQMGFEETGKPRVLNP